MPFALHDPPLLVRPDKSNFSGTLFGHYSNYDRHSRLIADHLRKEAVSLYCQDLTPDSGSPWNEKPFSLQTNLLVGLECLNVEAYHFWSGIRFRVVAQSWENRIAYEASVVIPALYSFLDLSPDLIAALIAGSRHIQDEFALAEVDGIALADVVGPIKVISCEWKVDNSLLSSCWKLLVHESHPS